LKNRLEILISDPQLSAGQCRSHAEAQKIVHFTFVILDFLVLKDFVVMAILKPGGRYVYSSGKKKTRKLRRSDISAINAAPLGLRRLSLASIYKHSAPPGLMPQNPLVPVDFKLR
jgi:hypothetical protein